jgi:hypothetical protein
MSQFLEMAQSVVVQPLLIGRFGEDGRAGRFAERLLDLGLQLRRAYLNGTHPISG